MGRTLYRVREFFSGKRAINATFKYMILGIGASIIHAIFAALFSRYDITPLFLYNVVITIFYLYLGLIETRQQHYTTIFMSTLIEILFHSAIASLILGWNWGFMIYTISLVPFAFNFSYTLSKLKGRIGFPIICSMIIAFVYFGIRILCDNMKPLYDGVYTEKVPTYCYYLNMSISFVLLLYFSVLFATEIRYMQRRLEQENQVLGEMANYDPLTHLRNRRSMTLCFDNALHDATQNGKPFCIIMADVDDFKKVNDSYGHECGDMVLLSIANIISERVRRNDDVCRWGGEEILILLQANEEVASQVAERICKDIGKNVITYKDEKVKVTATLGVSVYKPDKSVADMIEEADQKLYYGKNNGKNQVVI